MLELLDSAAQWWLDWRVSRALRKDNVHAELLIQSVEATERGANFVLKAPTLATIFEEAHGLMEEHGAVNFLEFKGVSKYRMPPKVILVTFQFDDGLSPGEMVHRLKAENVELKSLCANCAQTAETKKETGRQPGLTD